MQVKTSTKSFGPKAERLTSGRQDANHRRLPVSMMPDLPLKKTPKDCDLAGSWARVKDEWRGQCRNGHLVQLRWLG